MKKIATIIIVFMILFCFNVATAQEKPLIIKGLYLGMDISNKAKQKLVLYLVSVLLIRKREFVRYRRYFCHDININKFIRRLYEKRNAEQKKQKKESLSHMEE
jgi:hypothetical protein